MKQQIQNVTNLQLGFQFREPSALHTRQLSSFQYLAALYNDACQWDSGKPEWQRETAVKLNFAEIDKKKFDALLPIWKSNAGYKPLRQKGEYYAGTNGKSSMPVGWRRRKSNR